MKKSIYIVILLFSMMSCSSIIATNDPYPTVKIPSIEIEKEKAISKEQEMKKQEEQKKDVEIVKQEIPQETLKLPNPIIVEKNIDTDDRIEIITPQKQDIAKIITTPKKEEPKPVNTTPVVIKVQKPIPIKKVEVEPDENFNEIPVSLTRDEVNVLKVMKDSYGLVEPLEEIEIKTKEVIDKIRVFKKSNNIKAIDVINEINKIIRELNTKSYQIATDRYLSQEGVQ